ncbi:MAG: exodeoxyribonuclease VII small subunit [Phycisphaerales bacterium]|nr:exodeoxyribonuclease VII small subunit [Phycisphaerales bacterium]
MANPAPTSAQPGGREPESFERSLEQIEQIINRIESGEVGLERAISEYERGVSLIRRCREILDKAEQKVEELTRQMVPPESRPETPVRPPDDDGPEGDDAAPF